VTTFEIGDKVRLLPTSPYYQDGKRQLPPDTVGIVTRVSVAWISIEWDGGSNAYGLADLELVNNVKENNNMATVYDVMNLELDADTQLLRREGIEESSGALSSNGIALLTRILYQENKKAVVTKVKEIVADRKANAVDDSEE
jgi:hypothetical protein